MFLWHVEKCTLATRYLFNATYAAIKNEISVCGSEKNTSQKERPTDEWKNYIISVAIKQIHTGELYNI